MHHSDITAHVRHSAALIVISITLFSAAAVAVQPDHVLYAFSAPLPSCFGPASPLIADARGNLYGTTSGGGTEGQGCIFELSPSVGEWEKSVLWSFGGYGYSSGALVFDKAGNLYGTSGEGVYGGGAAFELSPSSEGEWNETILHSFGSGDDGWDPQSDLVFDNAGNLYGTTENGGQLNGGTVFKLTPGAEGWTETILYSFPASIAGPDGDGPVGGIVIGGEGRIYGVTGYGGAGGNGAIFELAPEGNVYKEKIIFSFNVNDGLEPGSGLTAGPGPALYGTTSFGGDFAVCPYVGCGIVYELAEDAQGNWNEAVLHEMNGSDGDYTVGPVAFDHEGNLYAAAMSGGIRLGSVFMLTPQPGGGEWVETVLHRFDFKFPNGKDGESPYAGVIYKDGKVFGTTFSGGVNDAGIVFEITPPASGSKAVGR